jgi:hypothetical protein
MFWLTTLLLVSAVWSAAVPGSMSDPRPLVALNEAVRGRHCLPAGMAALMSGWLQRMTDFYQHRLLTTNALERLRDELERGGDRGPDLCRALREAARRALNLQRYAIAQAEATVGGEVPAGWRETADDLAEAVERVEGQCRQLTEELEAVSVPHLLVCLRKAVKAGTHRMVAHHMP